MSALKGNIIEEKFKNFALKFNYLTIEETIEFYSIFSGYPFLELISFDYDLQTCIQKFIFERIDDLKPYFLYDENSNFQKDLESILYRLAIGDRKSYTAYKKENISQIRGRILYKTLFEKEIILREKSREQPIRKFKKQLVKKALRRYEIQDKLHFKDNFTRFWFTFVYPYENPSDMALHVKDNLEQYISLCFEQLCIELINKEIGEENIKSSGSYWDKNMEIDLLIETKDGTIIAGESKWKNHATSKKTLNFLQKKCQRAFFKVDRYALFSKSGFSKELYLLKDSSVSLYNLENFKALYD